MAEKLMISLKFKYEEVAQVDLQKYPPGIKIYRGLLLKIYHLRTMKLH